MHLSLSFSLLSRSLCSTTQTLPWMVRHRSTGHIVDLNTFFKKEVAATRLLLLGTNADLPPQPLVAVGRQHDWKFIFPSMHDDNMQQRIVTGSKGPATHQRRYQYMSAREYSKLCKQEDAMAIELQRLLENKVLAIVPTRFIVQDSLPSRLCKIGMRPQETTTLTFGEGFVGDWILVPPASCESAA